MTSETRNEVEFLKIILGTVIAVFCNKAVSKNKPWDTKIIFESMMMPQVFSLLTKNMALHVEIISEKKVTINSKPMLLIDTNIEGNIAYLAFSTRIFISKEKTVSSEVEIPEGSKIIFRYKGTHLAEFGIEKEPEII